MTLPAIVEEFLELTQVKSAPRQERPIVDIMAAKLAALGFEVTEDNAGSQIDGDAGNLIARLKGTASCPALMFSAHLDRVANHGHITPHLTGDGQSIRSDGTSILAADDVAGLCAILAGVRQVQALGHPHGDIEVVLSVAEEVGLQGARNIDYSQIRSKMAYVLDTSGPVGTLVNQAPTQYTFVITVYGRSAHAGIEPEKGINAIKVGATALTRLREGRLSPHSTANFGLFNAGQATNIVCDTAEIKGEARSTCPEEVMAYLAEVEAVFQQTTEEFGATYLMVPTLEYQTFLVEATEPVVQLAAKAMKKIGLEMKIASTGGGMDGNIFNQNGLTAVGLSPGFLKVHTHEEEQPVAELIKCGQLVAEIIMENAR